MGRGRARLRHETSRKGRYVIVSVQAVEKVDRPSATVAAAFGTEYDVQVAIDGRRRVFRVMVEDPEDQPVLRLAHFVDGQHKDVFREHQVYMSKICRLVIRMHDGKDIRLPVDLDES